MKGIRCVPQRLKDTKGIAAVYVTIMLVVFIGFAALAVDVGYFMVSRNQLQNAADAAALASARKLGDIYEPMSYEDQQTYVCDPSDILPVAQQVAANNIAAGKPVLVQNEDVIIGTWDGLTKTLTPTYNHPNAVRIITRRDTTAGVGGQVSTFFGRIFGINNMSLTATATAALTGESTAGEGGLPIPIGIPHRWFENPNFCGQEITFYPPCTKEPCDSAEGCAGYHTYTRWPANESFIDKTIMPGIPTGAFKSPETFYGTEFNFTGGTLKALMEGKPPAFQTLFDTMKIRNDPAKGDADNDSTTWTGKVVVYESSTCKNPNQSLKVIGFATIVITAVDPGPPPTVKGNVKCDYVTAGRGSGGQYGTMGSIPGLVE